jgi:hypothetical protein
MNENLITFKTWCRDAFQYLLKDHGFRELPDLHPKHANPFQVRFTNGVTELLILGESYGTVASVSYVTQDNIEVATQLLEPDWEPFKKRKMKKTPQVSQRDQIFAVAARIKARDSDILSGDTNRLVSAAARWRSICEKMKWK